jgi:hypothetical protein
MALIAGWKATGLIKTRSWELASFGHPTVWHVLRYTGETLQDYKTTIFAGLDHTKQEKKASFKDDIYK